MNNEILEEISYIRAANEKNVVTCVCGQIFVHSYIIEDRVSEKLFFIFWVTNLNHNCTCAISQIFPFVLFHTSYFSDLVIFVNYKYMFHNMPCKVYDIIGLKKQ